MRRTLFNLAAAISLVLLIVLCFSWVHSYLAWDSWVFRDARSSFSGSIGDGSLVFRKRIGPGQGERRNEVYVAHIHDPDAFSSPIPLQVRGPRWNLLGFTYVSWDDSSPNSTAKAWEFTIPLWAPALLLLILPVQWLRRRTRQNRVLLLAARGDCPGCGADLRTCYNAKCPNCGAERWKAAT